MKPEDAIALVEQLSRMTDPYKSDCIYDELEAFRSIIQSARELVGLPEFGDTYEDDDIEEERDDDDDDLDEDERVPRLLKPDNGLNIDTKDSGDDEYDGGDDVDADAWSGGFAKNH